MLLRQKIIKYQNLKVKNKAKKAFTFLELSIVILIISILISGFASVANRFYYSSKLATAGRITKESPVKDISNLIIWYETVMPQSFIQGEYDDNSSISTWYNLNPGNTSMKTASNGITTGDGINAYQATSASQPTYIADGINGLPVLRFDGSDDYLNFYVPEIANSNYSVFVVEQRRSSQEFNFFIGGSINDADFMSNDTNHFLNLGYRLTGTLIFSQFYNDINVAIASYTSPIPRIHSFIFNSNTGKDIYVNGTNLEKCTTTDCQTGLVSYSGAYIGKSCLSPSGDGMKYYYYYNGDIGEIIIYKKALSDQERRDVESYLSNKWGIKLTSDNG